MELKQCNNITNITTATNENDEKKKNYKNRKNDTFTAHFHAYTSVCYNIKAVLKRCYTTQKVALWKRKGQSPSRIQNITNI